MGQLEVYHKLVSFVSLRDVRSLEKLFGDFYRDLWILKYFFRASLWTSSIENLQIEARHFQGNQLVRRQVSSISWNARWMVKEVFTGWASLEATQLDQRIPRSNRYGDPYLDTPLAALPSAASKDQGRSVSKGTYRCPRQNTDRKSRLEMQHRSKF